MADSHFGSAYGGKPPMNYEQYFVPVIGKPLAVDLIRTAALQNEERVLDVACGTGIVARLASDHLGGTGKVAGLDPNAGMLAVARASASPDASIEWHESGAEAMPLADGAFDVVLCQMGLQFMTDKEAALREMRRVLDGGGRMVLNLPGPTPQVFAIMREGLVRHVGPEAAGFVDVVFSLHEPEKICALVESAGFRDVDVHAETKALPLPPPADFLWRYVGSTPLAGVLATADDDLRAALERDVVEAWRGLMQNDNLIMHVRVVIVVASV
ncbi:MAG: methyltransferase domain-containing protein [Rhodothermales bacterium]|nr:methyltransferase domain-containing protein [Rhodothermales bacterium]